MAVLIIASVLIILFRVYSYRIRKRAEEKRAELRIIREAEKQVEPQDDIQAQKPQSVNKEVVTQQYSLNDGLPTSLDSIVPDSKLFKRDMSGLVQYFKDMPNMERIYNEFTHAIRNGYSVENYLHEANLMDDLEIREIAGKGFSIIAGFLTDMLSIQENKELRTDLEACKKAESILLNP